MSLKNFFASDMFKKSTYISATTTWFLTLGSKLARIILILATLYMSAQLYPGISLPAGLSIAVFVIMSFALDMGGIGISQVAREAKALGSRDAARKGAMMSCWLVSVMIAGLVVISVEHLITGNKLFAPIMPYVQIAEMLIDTTLIVIRAVLATTYGHVISELEEFIDKHRVQEMDTAQANDAKVLALCTQVETLGTSFDGHVQDMSVQVHDLCTSVQDLRLQVHALSTSGCTPVDMSEFKRLADTVYSLSTTVQEVHSYTLSTSISHALPEPQQAAHNGNSTVDSTPHTDELYTLPTTALIVPGIPESKVDQVIKMYQAGTQWSDIPGNYSRTIKPIRKAYEAQCTSLQV